MNIGEPNRVIVVEPLELPVGAPEPEQEPVFAPEPTPAEPILVP